MKTPKRLGINRRWTPPTRQTTDATQSEHSVTPVLNVLASHSAESTPYKEAILNEIKTQIKEKELKLASLEKEQNKSPQLVEIERLVEIWKSGCKEAILYLYELAKSKNMLDNKSMAEFQSALCVRETVVEYFENDAELECTDCST